MGMLDRHFVEVLCSFHLISLSQGRLVVNLIKLFVVVFNNRWLLSGHLVGDVDTVRKGYHEANR